MPNEMTWTPGPWKVKIEGSFTRFYFDCHAIDPAVTREELEANTRLCAAAPELYEALAIAVQDCPCSPKERDSGHRIDCYAPAALETLAKARGESVPVQSPGDHQEQGGQNNG